MNQIFRTSNKNNSTLGVIIFDNLTIVKLETNI